MTPTELDAEVGRLVIAALETTGDLRIEEARKGGYFVRIGDLADVWGDTWLVALRRAIDAMTGANDD